MSGSARKRARAAHRGLIALLVAFGLAAWAVAAAQTASSVEITGVSVRGDRVVASVAVLDAGGNPVQGLSAGGFSAQVDGSRATVSGVESSVDAALPLGIVLTVDTSGSMAGASMTAAKSALAATVNALGPSDQAMVVTFAQTVSRAVEPTSDRAALTAAINAMQATGNTALFAGVSQAATASTSLSQPRKAVLLLSDGEDFGAASGGITREQALAAAQGAHAPFFVVGLGAEVDQQFLSALAESTGGKYFAAATPTELAQLYSRIAERLRQQYTVSVTLPAGLAAGSHQLTITSGASSARAPFELVSAAAPLKSQFSAIPAAFAEPVVVTLIDVPAGVSARFTIDGTAIRPESNGKSVRIDPYDWAPGAAHVLAAAFPPDAQPAASATFTVAALAPALLEPTALPDLRPGELVRLTVHAQPGSATARFLVDGEEKARAEAAPYEFVLPDGDYAEGTHRLRVVLESGGAEVAREFPFEIAATGGGGGSKLPVLLFALIAAGLALAGLVFVARRLLRNRSDRRSAEEATREVARLTSTGGAVGPGSGDSAPPWGMLRVVEGPDAGRVFELRADTELVGRGRHCSVRLTDKSLAEEHFILTREGRIAASSPGSQLAVDGVATRSRQLGANEVIVAAGSKLEFVRLDATP